MKALLSWVRVPLFAVAVLSSLAVALLAFFGLPYSPLSGANGNPYVPPPPPPLVFVVNSTADPGDGVCNATQCTLREALVVAGQSAGLKAINFNIPGAGPHIIQPTAGLPTITMPLIIDGYTQPGSSPNTQPPGQFTNAVIKVQLDGVNLGPGTSGLVVSAGGSIIRGLSITRFGGAGIQVFGPAGPGPLTPISGIVIRGNFIGLDASGMVAQGNNVGVLVDTGSQGTTVGGPDAAGVNVISGNNSFGIDLHNGQGFNVITGNLIGTDWSSTLPRPNLSAGIATQGGASNSNNTIGGVVAGAGNVVAFNGVGILGLGATSTGNRVLGNHIRQNIGLGIDWGNNGVTANDFGDPDGGFNNLQNFPVLALATAGSTNVQGTFNSTANTAFRLEFFGNSECDASGHGEGRDFLGFLNVTTDGSGNATFSGTFAQTVPVGQFVTATATDPAGNTSEFSLCKAVEVVPTGAIQGTKFDDLDGDGVKDPGEAGVSGVTICVSPGGCTTTNVTGNYSFTGLAAGNYTVFEFIPFGRINTTPTFQVVSVGAGQTVVGVNFGNRAIAPPPPDVQIVSQAGTTTNNTPTQSRFTNLVIRKTISVCSPVGAPKVTLTFGGGTVLTGNMTNIGGTLWEVVFSPTFPGGTATLRIDIDCPPDTVGYPENPANISGEDVIEIGDIVFLDPSGTILNGCSAAPLQGATVTLLKETPAGSGNFVVPGDSDHIPATNPQTTGADGAYAWVVVPGVYKVRAEKSGFVTAESASLVIPPPVTGLDISLFPVGGCPVVDTTPPEVTAPAGLTVECTTTGGTPVSNPLVQAWLASASAVDNVDLTPTLTNNAPVFCALGVTTVTFTATDDAGNTGSASSTITVVDTTAPSISSATASPNSLWPPNHKMVPVTVSVSVSDLCDPSVTCSISSVTSNEPVDGLGDGDTAPDWVITGGLTVDLRAERSGTGTGRVYTITVTCTDDSGNSSTKTVTVTVPHSKGK